MQDNLVTFCCARKTKKERKAGKKRNIESGEVEGAASKVEEAQSSTVVLSSRDSNCSGKKGTPRRS